jgi:hypothetical protein
LTFTSFGRKGSARGWPRLLSSLYYVFQRWVEEKERDSSGWSAQKKTAERMVCSVRILK